MDSEIAVYYLLICNKIKKCKKWTERMDKCLLSSYKQNEKINYGIHVSKNM
jgi:hypothetical protein